MKKKIAVIMTILLITATTVMGCVSKADYEVLQDKSTQLQQELTIKEATNQELTTQLNNKDEEIDSLQAELTSLNSKLTLFTIEQNSLKDKLAKEEKQNLQAGSEIDRLNQLATQATEALNKLKETYPPRLFNNKTELEQWLSAMPIPSKMQYAENTYLQGVKLQEQAAEDGYIISVAWYSQSDYNAIVWCEAMLQNGDAYWWYPDDYKLRYENTFK
jgi:septal ring factor EnvC (AmiA/AmiB activator)